MGRQPWVVYNLRRTEDGLSKTVAADQVLGSIVLFGVVYLLLFAVWVYVLNDKVQHGPDEAPAPAPAATTAGGLLDSAGRLVQHGGHSLTEAGTAPPGGRGE